MEHRSDIEPLDVVPILDRIDQQAKSLDRAVRLTQMADAKTAPILAVGATIAAVTVSQSGALGRLLNPDETSAGLIPLAAALLAAYVGAAFFAGILGVLVYLPRAPRTGGFGRETPASLVYFDDIRRIPLDQFRERSMGVSAEALEQDIIQQVHIVSGVAAVKMRYVRVALIATIVAFGAWLPLIAWAQA